MGADPPRNAGDGAELEPAPKPPNLWDVMQRQVDRVFADFIGGDYPLAPGEHTRGKESGSGVPPGPDASQGEGKPVAPDLAPEVVALILREAHVHDATGAPIVRPPTDIKTRLWFFHHMDVSLDNIVAVLRSRRSWPR